MKKLSENPASETITWPFEMAYTELESTVQFSRFSLGSKNNGNEALPIPDVPSGGQADQVIQLPRWAHDRLEMVEVKLATYLVLKLHSFIIKISRLLPPQLFNSINPESESTSTTF